MGVVKAAFGIASLAVLGIGAFDVAHAIPGAIRAYRTAESGTIPPVRTVKWSPGKVFPSNRLRSSGPHSQDSNTSPFSQPSAPETSSVSATSLNWAGVVQQGPSEMSVQASWTVPSFSAPATNPNSAVAEWIGLGGMQSNALIQVGTITSPQSSGQANTTVFWEKLPSSAVQVASIPQGAKVNAKIEPLGGNQWRLWLQVNGQAQPVIDQVVHVTPSQAAAIESSADWITEAPTTNHGLAPLAPVASTTMTNVKANGVPLAKMNPPTLQSIGLYSQTGQLMAAPALSPVKDSITVNTVYGSNLPQGTSPGGGSWAIQEPGIGQGYGNPFGGGFGNPFGRGSGSEGNPFSGWGYGSGGEGSGGWITIQPGSGSGGGITWSINF